ncbi:MAG: HlyD family type I secretion periplasmic adaptor subunit [Deltaproteobacteria bacterium]|nr:HlyD family type I secretion periplasmic adaptor subunit [Deltaproteobacteria bacterium]
MIEWLKKALRKDKLEYEFLPPVLEIIETPPSPFKSLLIWVVFLMVLIAFAWAYFGTVDEVATARGRVIPDGRLKVVQPIEAGVIRGIHVREGQSVKEGDVLIELDPTIKLADVESNEKSLSIHQVDRERLLAELRSGNMIIKGRGELFELQKKLKDARESEYNAREEAIKSVIAQKDNEIRASEAILVKLEKTYLILKEQESSLRSLFEQGYLTKKDLLDKQLQLYASEQEAEAQKKTVLQVREGLNEKKMNLDALKKEREKVILNDIVDSEKTIAPIEGEVRKARRKYELERLSSPVDGTVHGISAHTIGGVVTPAQPVVTVVPVGTPLIVEATALNRDIGFLEVGQEVNIKFDTFPFQKYGTIQGKVVWISPDSFDDEKLGPIYKMKVEMEKRSMNIDNRVASITPGMTVSVDVKTGKRRVIEFFLSPIVKYTKESLILR